MKNDVFHVRQSLWSHTFAEGKLRSFALRNVRSAEREIPQRAKRLRAWALVREAPIL